MTDALDPIALRDVYDAQLRTWMPDKLPPNARVEYEGPLVRAVGLDQNGFVTYRSLAGLSGADVDALIAGERDYFAARGEGLEWKLHGHDEPADLPSRLEAAGYVANERETVVIGLAAALAAAPLAVPAGIRLREVTSRADLDRIAEMEAAVWSTEKDRSHLAEALAEELAADPDGTTVIVAETTPETTPETTAETSSETAAGRGTVVSAGWVRYLRGAGFATLWGGSTLAEWRGRGIYKALVRYRARLAVARGLTYLQVDASDDSRPILERNGFVAVTTTTPYVYPRPESTP